MAKYECELHGDFDETLNYFHKGILEGSMSASYEDESYCQRAGVRCCVRVYERYSMAGGNRLSMTLTLVVTCLFLAGSIALTLADGVPYLAAAFEVASAMGTVGLTMGITTGLSPLSQGIIIAMMFLGRVGVLSFSIAFLIRDRGENKIRYPSVDVMIG